MLGSSKGSGDGGCGGGRVPQLWEPGLNGVGQFLGDLNYLNFRAENNAMKRVSVCVAKPHPGLTFLGSIAVRQPLAIWISFLSTYFCGFTFEIPTFYNIQAFQSVEHAIECNKRCCYAVTTVYKKAHTHTLTLF